MKKEMEGFTHAVQVLLDNARALITHDYMGSCPDETDPGLRDPNCDVCKAILWIEQQ